MRWHSKSLWPKQKYAVSPYSFRHQKAADIKTLLTEEEVAMVMGHCSNLTQGYYAGARLAKATNSVICVTASRKVDCKSKQLPYEPIKHRTDFSPDHT